MKYLKTLTQEELLEVQRKRKETREKLIHSSSLLIQDFLDLPHWRELASKHNIKLPSYYYPSTDVKVMRKYLKKIGIEKETLKDYLSYCGVATLQELCSLNPSYPCYTEIGLAMEYLEGNIKC